MLRPTKDKLLIAMNKEEQLALLVSVMQSAIESSIIAIDLKGIIVAWNLGAKYIYGFTAEEALGRHVSLTYPPEDIASGKAQSVFNKVLTSGRWIGEIRRIRKGGGEFNTRVIVSLRTNKKGEPIGFTMIGHDLTETNTINQIIQRLIQSEELLHRKNIELKKKSREAEQANALKSEFLNNISHELRTPLNAIVGLAEMLHDGLVDTNLPSYKEFLRDIHTSAQQLLTMINDVLDLEKVETGKMLFDPQTLDLQKILTEIKMVFATQLIKKKINFITHISDKLGDIVIDPVRFKQLLYNYVDNAIKFTNDGGTITVSVRPAKENMFLLEVEDTGIGIRESDLNQLFIKFHQIDAGAAKHYQGAGLGLTLSKLLVEAQGGKVGASSVFGQGSKFYAILPRQAKTKIENKKKE